MLRAIVALLGGLKTACCLAILKEGLKEHGSWDIGRSLALLFTVPYVAWWYPRWY